MKANAVALAARAHESRTQIAKALRDGGYEVIECEELPNAGRFIGVVVVDDQDDGESIRMQVRSWMRAPKRPRIVVISSKPAAWKTLASAHSDHLFVLAAPSFSWEIVDALRAAPPEAPRRA